MLEVYVKAFKMNYRVLQMEFIFSMKHEMKSKNYITFYRKKERLLIH